jgi:endonuclease/exonuclease/phosphatase family metal-dependent hydrolase
MSYEYPVRFMLYNIRYATGGKPWNGYLSRTQRNLDEIVGYVKSQDPDILGLVEVDSGSYRTGRQNQAEIMAQALGHYHCYKSKYAESHWCQWLPVLNKQGNAFLTRDTVHNERFHYFDRGFKKLVIELELENLTIFLVHLALGAKVRLHQLHQLYTLVKGTPKPHIVAGDFNVLWGDHEIDLFLAATGLCNPNRDCLPSFPSWAPKRHLDFILHSPGIRVSHFTVPRVTYSDHLPVVCDFDVL